MVAMENEASYLLSHSTKIAEKKAGFAHYFLCEHEQVRFVLGISGIGKAFAAGATASLLLLYPEVDCLINFGVSGSLDSQSVPLFSPIVATACIEHDLDTSAIGDPKGLVSGINIVSLPIAGHLKSQLLQAAKAAGYAPKEGVVSSGDTFYADAHHKKQIHDEFASLACDMESGANAQIACANNLPYACLRVISDADNASEEYPKNASKAADIAGAIVCRFLEAK